jgi:hypothetical protein
MQNDQVQTSRRQFLTLSVSATLLGLMPAFCYANVIREMQGQVWVNNQIATLNSLIQPGDTVKTGAQSRIIFVIGDDVYKLGARSTLRLRYNPGNLIVNALSLVSGSLLSIFGKSSENRILQAPTATIGIRGTGLYLQVTTDNTYFCTCYGNTEIITNSLATRHLQPVNATYHVAYSIGHDVHNPPVSSDIMKNHTDDELFYLESLVGRQPPVDFRAHSH